MYKVAILTLDLGLDPQELNILGLLMLLVGVKQQEALQEEVMVLGLMVLSALEEEVEIHTEEEVVVDFMEAVEEVCFHSLV